jgi:hypothetical protein
MPSSLVEKRDGEIGISGAHGMGREMSIGDAVSVCRYKASCFETYKPTDHEKYSLFNTNAVNVKASQLGQNWVL